MDSALQTFIDQQVAEFAPRLTRANGLQWLVATTSRPEYEQAWASEMLAIRRLAAEPARYHILTRLMTETLDAPLLLARQARLLHNFLRGNQIAPDLIDRITEIETRVQSTFNQFRATLAGRAVSDNDLRTVLRRSDDAAERREAWEASKQIGAQVAEDVRELARLRNQAARQAGFDNFYTMQLELDELDEQDLFSLFEALKAGTDPLWQAYKTELDRTLATRFGIDMEDVRPWHYADPFFQEGQPSEVNLDSYFADKNLEDLTRAYYSAIGMDVDDVLARSDLYERPGKQQHAFCIHIDRQGDVRVLCNNRPNEQWAGTMLHEFGHAVYDKYIDRDLPFLLRAPAHTLTTEAIAILGGNLIHDSAWLAHYAGVPFSEARRLEDSLQQAARNAALIFARWVFVMSHFERALYRDPEQDLNALWWDMVEHFQGVHRPDQRNAPDWAAKIHIATAPVYYHNYLLGAMIAAQLLDHILAVVVNGSRERYVSDPRIGAYLIDRAFRPGSRHDWRGWLREVTGQDLSAAGYIRWLSGATA
ncbi:MAG: M2 family metallopeptidase [Anaerolineae bacterium]|nr:M2 family metallopeptidase [Thermoflexales bacterium]MDW8407638.1 M2 family metallopeptidase [Anaerolineae bacterium]